MKSLKTKSQKKGKKTKKSINQKKKIEVSRDALHNTSGPSSPEFAIEVPKNLRRKAPLNSEEYQKHKSIENDTKTTNSTESLTNSDETIKTTTSETSSSSTKRTDQLPGYQSEQTTVTEERKTTYVVQTPDAVVKQISKRLTSMPTVVDDTTTHSRYSQLPTAESAAISSSLTYPQLTIANENQFETVEIKDVHGIIIDIFKAKIKDQKKYFGNIHRLQCPSAMEQVVKTRMTIVTHCIDEFEKYVTNLRRQHGVIRDAANDPAVFEPGIIIMGPLIKKDTGIVDKEDNEAMKKLQLIEPRKRYALILLTDIQRFNIDKSTWETIGTLVSPVAAPGMSVDGERIYLCGGYDILQNQTILSADFTIFNIKTRTFEKSNDLPSPRCRSLVFVIKDAVYCLSGLIDARDEKGGKKMKISTDILKWTATQGHWNLIASTPELTKFHGLSFNDPYLEITKRILDGSGNETGTKAEVYFDFRDNIWHPGKAPPITEQTIKLADMKGATGVVEKKRKEIKPLVKTENNVEIERPKQETVNPPSFKKGKEKQPSYVNR
ncbi:unnamed protein product [Didymodactylos carnosus]|uniref:Uncharacterized protein n=1 Tax=Didymodactylos carnosus TaxID=1234261 RepID=A0A814IIM7_9BILA|nr:unnamed protein product [Didymodactylos carnosus]CAF1023936.1 unnamed protein product [Didymodactylos carnosus]CAF3579357.1 unnamed protein product [Didymodactylos carnosus]CAF3795213.1 unnamed protein product [Didymodactylos carnosus]